MKEGQAKAIERLDYAPPAFWIDSVDLTFDLDPAKTRVLNKMQVRRNSAAAPQALRLLGQELNLARVLVNGAGTSFKIEGDELVIKALGLEKNELDAVEHIISQMEEESGSDRLAALADMRFSFIEAICARCVKKPQESREHERSARIDRVLSRRAERAQRQSAVA